MKTTWTMGALAALLVAALACGANDDASSEAVGREPSGGGAPSSSSGASSSSGGGSSGAGVETIGCKRGVAYGHHSEADLRALRPGIGWWYNWAYTPEAPVRDVFAGLGLDYVPMVWGGQVDLKALRDALLPDAHTLLGFNEPNFHEQANLSAVEAAARWPEVQAIADAKGLRLLSPAVNFCGGGCHDTDPYAYLDAFFAACEGCRVDAIAVHVYVGCAGDGDNHARWLIYHLRGYQQRFPHPLWLTEFACDDAGDEASQLAFLTDAVTYLENDPRVERYAWFAGRADNVAHVDLLGADGQLTALGRRYVELPAHTPCHVD